MGNNIYFVLAFFVLAGFLLPLLLPFTLPQGLFLGTTQHKPNAKFTFSPATPQTGQAITFDAMESDDFDGFITSYSWNFGDGTKASGMKVKKIYSNPGSYRVTLTVRDSSYLSASTSKTAKVSLPQDILKADFKFTPAVVEQWQKITFDATPSRSATDTITSYSWAFGDGTRMSGKIVEKSYIYSGEFKVNLMVRDSKGKTASVEKRMKVLTSDNQLPTAVFSYTPEEPAAGELITFDATNSSDFDGIVASYNWSFGDGIRGSGMIVQKSYDVAGAYEVKLTVRDNGYASSGTTNNITVH